MGKKDKAKGQGKRKDKVQAKRGETARRDIARAERRLAKALRRLEDARGELLEREARLAALLVRHGRMPAPNGAQSTGEGSAPADDLGESPEARAAHEVTVPAPPAEQG